MTTLLRLVAMLMWLTVTSRIYWALVAVAMYGVWTWRLPQWAWLPLFACVAAVSLANAVLVEADGALCQRVRFVHAERVVLASAVAAITVLTLSLWLVACVLRLRLPPFFG